MIYRDLGKSGLSVSPICLGAMMFGARCDEATAKRIVDHGREAGVNFIDTADVYSKGVSEEIVGRLIAANRDHWILATKAGNTMHSPEESGLSRKWLMQAIDNSLARLGTDYVDIYYLHKPDHETPFEETLGAIGEIIAAGKVRHFGLSNYRGWEHADAVRLCDDLGVPRPVVSQPYYNAMTRVPEIEILPACGHYGMAVVPYSPLARGVLTGKYTPGEAPPQGTRAGHNDTRIMETEFRQESLEYAQKIKARAEKRGMTAGQFALNWLLANPLVTSILAGPRTEEQWEEYLGALKHSAIPEDEGFIDAMAPSGHASTPGYSDPQYPITGRPVKG